MRSTHLLIGIMLIAPCLAAAQKVTLRLNPTVNKPIVYTVKSESTQQVATMNLSSSQNYTLTAKATKKAGNKITLQSVISNVDIKLPESSPARGAVTQMELILEGATVTATYDDHFKLLSTEVDKKPPMVQSVMRGVTGLIGGIVPYPNGRVGVGSTWSKAMDFGEMTKAAGVTTKGGAPVVMRLERFLTVSGKACVELSKSIKGTMTMTRNGNDPVTSKLNSTATIIVELSTGMVLRANGLTKTSTVMGAQTANVTQRITMTAK